MKSFRSAEVIDTVRNHYKKFIKSYETLESVFLAFRAVVKKTKRLREPIDHLHLHFYEEDHELDFYWDDWDEDEYDRNKNQILIAIHDNPNSHQVFKAVINIYDNSKSYFADLFECAVYLQTNYPNIIKSMNLESILFAILSEDKEFVVGYSSDFSLQTSRYVPLEGGGVDEGGT